MLFRSDKVRKFKGFYKKVVNWSEILKMNDNTSTRIEKITTFNERNLEDKSNNALKFIENQNNKLNKKA
jgi:hypothetical protein